MGNHLDSEPHKVKQNVMVGTNETEWETVNMTTLQTSNKKAIKKLTPMPQKMQFDNVVTYKHNSNRMRWSNTRKVTKASKLSAATRSIKMISEEQVNINEEYHAFPNSTICVGGLPFQKSMLDLSPIRQIGVCSQKEVVMPLTKSVIESKNRDLESSACKVKRWLVNTEKHFRKTSNDQLEIDHQKDTVVKVDNACNENKCLGFKNFKCKKSIQQKKIQVYEPSPIHSVFKIFERETTLESEILADIVCINGKTAAKENAKVRRRRKRKRITMKVTPKKKRACNVKKEIKASRIKGKELVVTTKRSLGVGITSRSLVFNQRHEYNLRSRDKNKLNCSLRDCVEKVSKDEEIKEKKRIFPKEFIGNKEFGGKKICYSKKSPSGKLQALNTFATPSKEIYQNQPEAVFEGECKKDSPNETPSKLLKSSSKSTKNSKRRLSFYDRSIAESTETIKSSKVGCWSTNQHCSSKEYATDFVRETIFTNKHLLNSIETLNNTNTDSDENQSDDVSSCCLVRSESVKKHLLMRIFDEKLLSGKFREISGNNDVSMCFLEGYYKTK